MGSIVRYEVIYCIYNERSNATSKEWWLCGCKKAERSYSTFNVRRGGREEIPLIQDKELQPRFAGAAMKRYLMSKVRETQLYGRCYKRHQRAHTQSIITEN